MELSINIPEFTRHIFYGYARLKGQMSTDQREFYELFRDELNHGNALDVGNNISYIFLYAFDLTESGSPADIENSLSFLIKFYGENNKVYRYLSLWRSEILVSLGKYREAIDAFPDLGIGKSNLLASFLLNLKYITEQDINANDIIYLFGFQMSKYVRNDLVKFSLQLDNIISDEISQNGSVLRRWLIGKHVPQIKFHSRSQFSNGFVGYDFGSSPHIYNDCKELMRRAENNIRDDLGIPRIGEGWIEETRLFHALSKELAPFVPIMHAKPRWMGQQHLDILIPELHVAVEYQGIQHDKAVGYFGGEEAFHALRERDQRKRKLCESNGVKLIEVRPGYDLSELIRSILGYSAKDNSF